MVTPNAFAASARCSTEGGFAPLSQYETAATVTPILSASSRWVSPRAERHALIRSARFTVAIKYDSTYRVKSHSTAYVFSSLLDMARQSRPTGRPWPVDDAWKKDVLAKLAEAGISRAQFARDLGVTPSAITTLFRDVTESTRLKSKIHKLFGWLPPEPGEGVPKDEIYSRLMRGWKKLSKSDQAFVLATVDRLVSGH